MYKKLLLKAGVVFTLAIAVFANHHFTAQASKPVTSESVKITPRISHPVLLTGEDKKAYIQIVLEGFEPADKSKKRPPVNIALVLDRSGSMNGNKIEHAKQAALLAVDRLADDDIISIVVYDDSADVIVPATKLSDRASIKSKIRSINIGGSTALFAGTSKGANEVEKFLDKNKVNRVILLSDGQANVGPSSPSELGELGNALVKKGISVTTLGLGTGYNEDLMVKLAQKSDGNHAFIENPEELASIFDKEFGDVLSVVAQEVEIQIECVDGVKPIRLLGREGEIYGQTTKVNLNQLYANQSKEILLEVNTNKDLKVSELVTVKTVYRDMQSGDSETQNNKIFVKYSNDKKDVEAKTNKIVMAEAIKQEVIIENERAIKLRDAGKIKEAQERLYNNAMKLKEAAPKYGGGLDIYADEVEQEAKDIEDTKKWNVQRKGLSKKQYQYKNKQAY